MLNLEKMGKRYSIYILLMIVIAYLICTTIAALSNNNLWLGGMKELADTLYPYWLVISGGVAVTGIAKQIKGGK